MVLCRTKLHQIFLLVIYVTGTVQGNLTCYHCFTRWELDDCVLKPNTSNTKICSANEPYCMVLRNETYGKFTLMRRKCAATCRPICGVWGDDVDWESCVSCCSTDLCNTDNGGIYEAVINRYVITLVIAITWMMTSS